MKAILVLNDMPESCIECPCEYDELYCQESEHQLSYGELFDHRPENCPLKEMPDLKARTVGRLILEADERHINSNYYSGYCKGWNDCIDVIGGKDE